ncbi:ABC transporter ATP-binding protein [Herbiconiux sp. 11R-BC]|uniref:ABC transporter ATP-binding protein n=1 Tax=Herbiconiux sp. 11R-BC TaxID=3111637 RepID=UPI003C04CB3A
MTEPTPLIAVTDARIRHLGSTAATPDGVTFTVHPGEVLLILGPSGCGKSTLALALDGLVPHAVAATLEGEVRVAGAPTTESTVAALSEHVAMVFQDPDAQIVTGTVLDEVCFGPENLRLPVDEVLARAERALRQVGLWERRAENPDRLSGGGRQRLAIACALALGSPVIVLDEPTANLDPRGIEEVYAVLSALVRERDHAIVLVEHDLDAAMGLVDRVLVLDRHGRPVAEGPAGAVLRSRAPELLELGVWLPTATLAGLRMRAAGIPLPELPLTPAELTAALDALGTAGDAPPPAALLSHSPWPASPSPTSPSRPAPTSGPTPPSRSRTPSDAPTPTLPEASARDGADPAVRVHGLRVAKSRTSILHGIDLEVGRGDFLAVVGTNGAGKTTLLQAIAGVVPPPKGTVDVLGLDPARADVRALARTVGFVFQNPEHQFIRATVAEELAHGLELQSAADPSLHASAIADRVDRMLDRFGLTELRDAHPFLLSGGQKRRLSVGTALIAGAPVLVLDEPTFGQDRARAAELLGILSALNAEGTTVIVATHDLQLVADHASHVLVLAGGAVAAHGTTDEILRSDALESAGLRAPALVQALRATADPRWHGVTGLDGLEAAVRMLGPAAPEPGGARA